MPRVVQRAVWRNYRAGQRDDKSVSREWLQAAGAAIAAVAMREGVPTTTKEQESLQAFFKGK